MPLAVLPTDLSRLEAHRRALYSKKTLTGATGRQIPLDPVGLTQEAGLALRAIVEQERPERTIETGMAVGMSTVFILEGALAARPGRVPRHVATGFAAVASAPDDFCSAQHDRTDGDFARIKRGSSEF